MILHTVSDLIALAARHAPTAAVAREIRSGGFTVHRVLTGAAGLPGWIVRSRSGRMVGVWADDVAFRWVFSWPDKMPADAVLIRGEKL